MHTPLQLLHAKLTAPSPAAARAVGQTRVYRRSAESTRKQGRGITRAFLMLMRQSPPTPPGIEALRLHLQWQSRGGAA